jgi:hypothetical protein
MKADGWESSILRLYCWTHAKVKGERTQFSGSPISESFAVDDETVGDCAMHVSWSSPSLRILCLMFGLAEYSSAGLGSTAFSVAGSMDSEYSELNIHSKLSDIVQQRRRMVRKAWKMDTSQ